MIKNKHRLDNQKMKKQQTSSKKTSWTDHPSTIEREINQIAKKYSVIDGDKGKMFLRELKDKIKAIYL